MKDSASRLGTYTDGCRIRFLTNLSLRVFIFIAFPLGYNILKSRHAMRARFHVFLRSHPEGGCQNSGMIVAPFASCLSSGNREPLFGCASPPSFLPACARAADAVVRDGDLGSRNPVHRGHGARHSIDACVPPGSTTNEGTLRRPRRVRGAREALKKPRIGIRGPAGRRPTPPRDDLARHFRERSISRSAVFTDVKARLNFAGREQALVSPRICKVGKGCSGASLEAVCLKVLCKFAGWGSVQRCSFRGQGVF